MLSKYLQNAWAKMKIARRSISNTDSISVKESILSKAELKKFNTDFTY